MGLPLRKTFRVLSRDGQHGRENAKVNSRVTLDAMRLAEVCLVDTIDFGKFDVLLLESGGCFLVMGSKNFAVTAPVSKLSQWSRERMIDATMEQRTQPELMVPG